MALGFNSDKVAQGEIDSGGLDSRGKMTEWDIGDDARAIFYGLFGKDYSRSTLEKKARAKQTADYNDRVSDLNTQLSQYRPGTTITRQDGETLADMRARGDLQVGLGKTIAESKITNPEVDFSGAQTVQDVYGLVGKDNKRQKDEKEKKEKTEQIRLEKRQDYKENRDRLDRLENRRSELELRRDNMTLEYARMARQDRLAAQDRRDKAIMTLMQGLGNLGAAFTI